MAFQLATHTVEQLLHRPAKLFYVGYALNNDYVYVISLFVGCEAAFDYRCLSI